MSKTRVFCDASEENEQICELDGGGCKNSGAEYGATISNRAEMDCFMLCRSCSKKLKDQAEEAGYAVYVRKLSNAELKDLGY